MPSNSNGGRRRPTPQAHSDRLTGLYKDEDRKRAVRPVLCPLTPEQLGELTLNEILSTLPGGTQTEVLRIVYPNQKKPRKAALVDCLQGAKLGNSLSEFVTRLKHLKYDVQALFSRAETAAAYRLLVDTIGVLGPGNPVDPGRTRDKDFYEEQKNCVATACQAFCRLLAPDGQAAYFRNRCFNRTDLLYTSGLRFPETMYGFVWTPDLPTRVIFDDGRRMIYPPFPQGVEPPQAPGRFRVREQVDRVVGVRLAWGVSTVALFLNWRRGGPASSNGRSLDSEDGHTETIKSLELAVRYFIGWLQASGLDLSQAYDDAPRTPHKLIAVLGRAARQEDQGGGRRCSRPPSAGSSIFPPPACTATSTGRTTSRWTGTSAIDCCSSTRIATPRCTTARGSQPTTRVGAPSLPAGGERRRDGGPFRLRPGRRLEDRLAH